MDGSSPMPASESGVGLAGISTKSHESQQDFEIFLDPNYPVYWAETGRVEGEGYYSFRIVNRVVFVNDIGRCKATGLPFEYSGVINLKLKGGELAQADEWLRVPFQDSVSPDKYITISDGSLEKLMRKDLHKDS
ncbi:hypothetical protein LY78DRAFT_683626 [Colletotrichum sublineola]|nr:hypothetical protein LY78DRAFT_683626 [Colletotrichum sublineola]